MVPAQSARAITACALLAVLAAAPAWAQLQPEARVELVRAEGTQAEVGVGVVWRAGTYLRAGLMAAGDVWGSVDTVDTAARAEFALRFTMDPIAQQRWGVSVGGGAGYRHRAYLLAVAEVEGPRRSGVRPAFQLSLGGGARFAFVLRRATARGR